MPKITFMGAGSTVFAKNILGDCMCSEVLRDSHLALYDIDATRLRESKQMLDALNANLNKKRARITAHLGVRSRRAALRDADFVVNAIQVGGYEPSTVIDFEIPKKYGLRQTIADTLGIGGIFRTLRTLPVMLDFAHDMEAVCPDAWMLNYTNPMAMVTGGVLEGSSIRAVGLCHSVQGCAGGLLRMAEMSDDVPDPTWEIAGINHQAWLLSIRDGDKDLYPEIKKRLIKRARSIRKRGPQQVLDDLKKRYPKNFHKEADWHVAYDLVRLHVMEHFGHYVTESSEHSSEYMPWYIKRTHPELIQEFNIPLDEYPRRCVRQIEDWKARSHELVKNPKLSHSRGHEYGSYIMEAIISNVPTRVHGNIMNTGLITNLPARTCVEVPCLVDRNGVQGCYVGDLPEQCAALNRTNINVQLLTVSAVLEKRKDLVYQAAALDPHTSSELTLDETRSLCDDLFKAHGDMIPKMK